MGKRALVLSPNNKIPLTPKKKREASLYALWLSVPIALRDQDMEALEKAGYMNGAGVQDFLTVLRCKSKKEFCKAFHVSSNLLNLWDRAPWLTELVDQLSIQNNVMRFKKDLDFNFTQRTLKDTDPASVKLWKQVYEGWTEKKQLSGSLDLKQVLDNLDS